MPSSGQPGVLKVGAKGGHGVRLEDRLEALAMKVLKGGVEFPEGDCWRHAEGVALREAVAPQVSPQLLMVGVGAPASASHVRHAALCGAEGGGRALRFEARSALGAGVL